jgi:hypothetical protein
MRCPKCGFGLIPKDTHPISYEWKCLRCSRVLVSQTVRIKIPPATAPSPAFELAAQDQFRAALEEILGEKGYHYTWKTYQEEGYFTLAWHNTAPTVRDVARLMLDALDRCRLKI